MAEEHGLLALLEAVSALGSSGVLFAISWKLLGTLERVLIMVVEHETKDGR